jgi:hypothetical protein
MIQISLQRLTYLCETVPKKLLLIKHEEFSFKPSPQKWSKKEIIGHLIDSAANNHQRFVRIQFEDRPFIVYDQDQWNKHSYYQLMDAKELIEFWAGYNKHLAALIKEIPTESLSRQCKVGEDKLVTLEFLINDYVVHMEHHLKQLIDYD